MSLALGTTESGLAYATRTAIEFPAATIAPSVGDGLLAGVWMEVEANTVPTPSGWTSLASLGSTPNHFKLWWFGRIAEGNAADSFTATIASTPCLGGMHKITGTPGAVSNWKVGTGASAESKEAKAGATRSPTPSALGLMACDTYSAATVKSVTGGWSRTGTNLLLLAKEAALAAEESSGEPVITFEAAATWIALMLVVPPKVEELASPHNLTLLGVGS